MFQSRTHTCGELRLSDAGKNVTLAGWLENVREVGSNFAFLVLRDYYGTTQVVVQNEEMMLSAMKRAKALGKPISAHCEDNSLLRGGYIHDGEYAKAHGHRGICSESEFGQIARDIELVKKSGCKYHVCHISTKESVDIIRRAKAEGVDITCETGPHYLTLTDLADHLGYEYHYFSAVFHQCFGIHFKKFLNLFRVEKAYALLLKDDRDVTEICAACGFSGLRNFNRVFKQISGFTPTEYRRHHRPSSHHLSAKS